MEEPSFKQKAASPEPQGSVPQDADGSKISTETESSPGAGLIRPGLAWASLLLAPLAAVLLIPLWLSLSAGNDRPSPAGGDRIETSAAFPRIAWLTVGRDSSNPFQLGPLEGRVAGALKVAGRDDLAHFLRTQEGSRGAVFFVPNLMVDNTPAGAALRRQPGAELAGADRELRPAAVDFADRPASRISTPDPIRLRLGDVAYGGIILPQAIVLGDGPATVLGDGNPTTPTDTEIESFYAAVMSADLLFADAEGNSTGTTPELIAGAAIAALLKAESRRIERLTFVQSALPSGDNIPRLSPARWITVMAQTIDRVAPYLRWVNEVYLVATLEGANVAAQARQTPTTPARPGVQVRQTPAQLKQLEQKNVEQQPIQAPARVQEEPPAPQFDATALDLPAPTLRDRYTANLKLTFAASLPWQEAANILAVQPLDANTEWYTQAGRDGLKVIQPELVNPAYRTTGRASFVPLAAYFLVFALVVAWSLRRQQPAAPKLPNLLFAWWLTLLFGGLTLLALAFLGDWWLQGLGLTGVDTLDAGVALGAASLIGGLGGFISGEASYLAARRQRPKTGEEQSTEPVADRLRPVLYRDVPVERLEHDSLGFGALVRALVSFLDNKRTEPPLVLAINGPWGSGKSSIMRMLTNELDATRRFRIAWFNAWRYQKQDQILAAFLHTVANQLSREWGVWFSLRLAWIRLKNASLPQLCLLSVPFLLLLIFWQAPHLFHAIGETAGGADESAAKQIAKLATQGVTGVGGVAGLIWLTRFLLPFRVSYRKLFGQHDASQQIGFLDQFEREFQLYREAADREKFLIMIDDLDRCHPDAVVEVMKTINLIVTSEAGAGKTFFVLGFDSRFILRSVEHHFKEFAKLGAVVEGRFGPQYLKKIVNIAVSVPEPNKDALQKLVENLSRAGVQTETGTGSADQDTDEQKPQRTRLQKYCAGLFHAMRQPLPVFALFIALAVGFILSSRNETPVSQQATQSAQATRDPAGGAAPITSSALSSPSAAGDIVQLPALSVEPQSAPLDVIEALLTALVLLGTLMAIGGVVRSAIRAQSAPPEPDDSAEFIEAVLSVKDRLPSNPRDVVRIVNRMRLAYLIQTPPKRPVKGYNDPFAGEPLAAADSITLTLLQQTHPHIFDPQLLERLIGTDQDQAKTILAILREIEDKKGKFRELAVQYGALAAECPALADRDKMLRFLAVNRFVLQRYEILPEGDGEKEAEVGESPGEREGVKEEEPNETAPAAAVKAAPTKVTHGTKRKVQAVGAGSSRVQGEAED